MATGINWAFTAQIEGGPSLQISGSVAVEGYEQIEVKVGDGLSKKVSVQPSDGGNFLLIYASTYDSITYEVLDGANAPVGTPASKTLDGPHLLIGEGAVGLLETAEHTIRFHNGSGAEATIYILLGRDATP